jgi:hypothetical protein
MLKKEEDEEKLKEYKKLLEGLESIFIEFQNINNRTIEKKSVKKISSKKDTKINLNNNEFYKSLLESEQHSGKLTLLDEKQALDENESYQKIIDLFLQESETIPSIEKEGDDPNKYLLTQIFTAFSLLERKIYFSGDKDLEEKSRNFFKNLNMIKFNKETKLTPEMLEYFNHNILRIEDIFQSREKKINSDINNNLGTAKKNINEKNDIKPIIIEAKEINKKEIGNKNNLNMFESFNNDGNVILNDETKDEGLQQIDSISYERKFANIDLSNEEYKRIKSINLRKILELDNEKLKNITKNELQELINEVYTSGKISNKTIECKLAYGQNKLFNKEIDDNNIKVTNTFISPNEVEISLNQEEKMENDEEIADDKDILDFDQEEIKTQQNKTLFFEKEDFEKEFFPNIKNNEDEKEINNDKKSLNDEV